ncbi:hypothetical protein DFH08DRAFT_804325 [Mycena albidolilacea]|uniref:Uncharacterized protein n=1 Tax=Mycena albidolilacea TaxID=1033008 RepID=A0AAD7ABW8_9AGAR|nr:hypothetical protein DFH08DRAFT_804325 [Mycena albidolilacea]
MSSTDGHACGAVLVLVLVVSMCAGSTPSATDGGGAVGQEDGHGRRARTARKVWAAHKHGGAGYAGKSGAEEEHDANQGSSSMREEIEIGIEKRKDEIWDKHEVPRRAGKSSARKIVRKELEKERAGGGKHTIVVYRDSARPDSDSMARQGEREEGSKSNEKTYSDAYSVRLTPRLMGGEGKRVVVGEKNALAAVTAALSLMPHHAVDFKLVNWLMRGVPIPLHQLMCTANSNDLSRSRGLFTGHHPRSFCELYPYADVTAKLAAHRCPIKGIELETVCWRDQAPNLYGDATKVATLASKLTEEGKDIALVPHSFIEQDL